jgi:hypothetical protein
MPGLCIRNLHRKKSVRSTSPRRCKNLDFCLLVRWTTAAKDSIPASGPTQRIADLLAKENAQLWINHDKVQRDSLKMAPDYYD